MLEVHLKHVIFTRVEKAYSPRGVSGYQVVYQSPSLGAGTAEIEKYVQCFLINKQQMNRYQFFWTTKDQAVCTKSVSLISPDREVIDRDQRDAFLTHALVLSREDFARVRNDPFAVFEAAESLGLLTESVQQLVWYLRTTPPPEQISVSTRTQAVYPLDGWSKEELQRLYRLVEAAPVLNEQNKSILMITADPAETYRLLSSLLILLPLDERAACTFDTFVDNCTPSAGSFWTIGGTRALNNSNFVSMRLSERQIAPVKPGDAESAYSTWFSYALQRAESFAQLNEDLYSAQLVAEAFKAHQALPERLPSERVLHTFRHLHGQTIDASLGRTLASVMARPLAEVITPALYDYLPLSTVFSLASQGTCDRQVLAGIVYSWFLKTLPAWKEWEDVLEFATQVGYAPLLLLASLKARPRPFKSYEKIQLQAIQALLDSGILSQVLTDLSGGAQPAPANEAPVWHSIVSDEEFQTLIHALLQQKVGNLLSEPSCVQRVAFLQNRKIVLDLAKAAAASQNTAPEFVQTLQQHPLYAK